MRCQVSAADNRLMPFLILHKQSLNEMNEQQL